ncbi:hypothetical protein [Mucilaginibacter sp. UR6-11]|uniref:hypothetical protein n=1 Tax=Mucilaginibacter sp. UR6-11 TaxID=1435644 RepID=UPI001E63494E|nr:hypothetical protein [Mucilaginibacter sp. UR6-11]MCC8427256.1 hypothetical protein [Mucilaginibacter sp. UR6-11]
MKKSLQRLLWYLLQSCFFKPSGACYPPTGSYYITGGNVGIAIMALLAHWFEETTLI